MILFFLFALAVQAMKIEFIDDDDTQTCIICTDKFPTNEMTKCIHCSEMREIIHYLLCIECATDKQLQGKFKETFKAEIEIKKYIKKEVSATIVTCPVCQERGKYNDDVLESWIQESRLQKCFGGDFNLENIDEQRVKIKIKDENSYLFLDSQQYIQFGPITKSSEFIIHRTFGGYEFEVADTKQYLTRQPVRLNKRWHLAATKRGWIYSQRENAGIFQFTDNCELKIMNAENQDGHYLLYAGKTGGDYVKFTTEGGDREPLQFELKDKTAMDLERANLNEADADGLTLLHKAAEEAKEDQVKFLIAQGVDLNPVDENGETPFCTAAWHGNAQIIKIFLDVENIQYDKADNDGKTPICIAAEKGYVDVVKLLTEKEVDLVKADNDGNTPIYIAAKNGHMEIVKLLAEKQVDLIKALRIAADEEHREIADFLTCMQNSQKPNYVKFLEYLRIIRQ